MTYQELLAGEVFYWRNSVLRRKFIKTDVCHYVSLDGHYEGTLNDYLITREVVIDAAT